MTTLWWYNTEQWWHQFARPFLDFVLPWFTQSSTATPSIHGTPVIWCSAAYRDVRHGQIIMTCDAGRLTVETHNAHQQYCPNATRIGLFGALCQASFRSVCFKRPGFASADQLSTRNSHIHTKVMTRQWIAEFNLCGKTNESLFYIVLLSLSRLSTLAPIWSLLLLSMNISFMLIIYIWIGQLVLAFFH